MKRSILRIVGCRRLAHTLQRALGLVALAACGAFGAAGAAADEPRDKHDAPTGEYMKYCREEEQAMQKNFQDFRNRPFSVVTGSTTYVSSAISACATAASSGDSTVSSTSAESMRDRAVAYIDIQGAALWQDMARGQGERLVVLASLMGCTGDSVTTFETSVQAAFGRVVFSSSATPEQVWNGVHRAISEDRFLSTACSAAAGV